MTVPRFNVRTQEEVPYWVNRICHRLCAQSLEDVSHMYKHWFTNRIQRVPSDVLVAILGSLGLGLFVVASVCKWFQAVVRCPTAWIQCLNDHEVTAKSVPSFLMNFWKKPPRPEWPRLQFQPGLSVHRLFSVHMRDKTTHLHPEYYVQQHTFVGESHVLAPSATTLVYNNTPYLSDLSSIMNACPKLCRLYIDTVYVNVCGIVPLFTHLLSIKIEYAPDRSQRVTFIRMKNMVFQHCTSLFIKTDFDQQHHDQLDSSWLPDANWPRLETFQTNVDIWLDDKLPFCTSPHPTLSIIKLDCNGLQPYRSRMCAKASNSIVRLYGPTVDFHHMQHMQNLEELYCSWSMNQYWMISPHLMSRLTLLAIELTLQDRYQFERLLAQTPMMHLKTLTIKMLFVCEDTSSRITRFVNAIAVGCPILNHLTWWNPCAEDHIAIVRMTKRMLHLSKSASRGNVKFTHDSMTKLHFLCPCLDNYVPVSTDYTLDIQD